MPSEQQDLFPLRKIAVIGNYLPRRCGIATFTYDLVTNLNQICPELSTWVVAMNDVPEGYPYPPAVRLEVVQNRLIDYRQAAEFLNMNRVDLVCVQHEYGIFGGDAGRHLLALLKELRMPVVVTLHTVLKDPDPAQRMVMKELVAIADRLVVMSQMALEIMQDVYGASAEQLSFIHHGIPDVPFVDPNFYKDQFGVEGKRVVMSFGLLSANKGIEFLIEALPDVVSRYPDVVCMIIGATHPHVKRREGESYRLRLQQLAKDLKVADHLVFHNRFVDAQELYEFLGAADLYVTPYKNEAQIVSGTLAYAMGTGKAVISTPYWYAKEMLADERGRLIPFRDSRALAAQLIDLFDNPAERHAMRKRAYQFTRSAVWPEVARQYLHLFTQAKEERRTGLRPVFLTATLNTDNSELPDLELTHLERLTDDTGILQHAVGAVPRREFGYTTDDNARALLFTVLAEPLLGGTQRDRTLMLLGSRYLAFLYDALDRQTGFFRNELTWQREWATDAAPSEDCHGRALWALGTAVGRSANKDASFTAALLFEQALGACEHLHSPRSQAFALLGLEEYLTRFPGDAEVKRIRRVLVDRLLSRFAAHGRRPTWPWFENVLTYDNAVVPHALLRAGYSLGDDKAVRTGERALRWLLEIQTEHGHFAPVGNQGWYPRRGVKARFDQQPLEAHSTVEACVGAFGVTGERLWVEEAYRAYEWFMGANEVGAVMCDVQTGASYDGLQADGPNLNQGAEATLSWLLVLARMHELRAELSMLRSAPGLQTGAGKSSLRSEEA